MEAYFAIPKLFPAILVIFSVALFSFATFGLAATAKLHTDEGIKACQLLRFLFDLLDSKEKKAEVGDSFCS